MEFDWNVENKEKRIQRKVEIDMVLRERLSMSIFRKLDNIASLSNASEKPVPKLESIVRMVDYFKCEINDRIDPLVVLLNKHIASKNDSVTKTVIRLKYE
jgi:hypothetical protein